MTLPGTVIFDLDGTLVDTAPDLTAALNHALAALGRPPVSAADVRQMVGLGGRKLLDRGLTRSGESTPDLVEAGFGHFLDHYARHICDGSRPFPGVEAALDALAAAGCRLGICTNKPVALSIELVGTLGWTGRFAANLGADSRPYRKPDPRHLTDTIAAVGGDPADCVYVGDSVTDITTARAAGVPVVAVSFGYSDVPVAELGPDAVVDSFDALLAAIVRVRSVEGPQIRTHSIPKPSRNDRQLTAL